MTREEIMAEINALHQLLDGSDYKSAQLIESLVETMQDATALNFIARFISWLTSVVSEYGEAIRQRAAWRQSLRELEEELDSLTEEAEA